MTLYKITPETTFVNELGKWKDLDGPREAFLPNWAMVQGEFKPKGGIQWKFLGFDEDVAYIVSNEP